MSDKFSLEWAYAYGEPGVTGLFRQTPEDFQVVENLGFDLSGQGEHVYLHVEKRGENTDWIARQIARFAGVKPNDVSYAGLKDRHAVTSQWFSVYFPKGTEPDWSGLESPSVRLLAVIRHSQKLRRGAHQSNSFCIRLHQLDGDLAGLPARLDAVIAGGVPNYFGQQRFGRDGNNVQEANRLLVEGVRIANRHQRGMIMSAARSYLFNRVLSARIDDGSWNHPLDGDVSTPEGGATGPLWGRGRPLVTGACAMLEAEVLQDLHGWCEGLEHVGLSQERRALMLRPEGFTSQLQERTLELRFSLPPGTYATSVLREISHLRELKEMSVEEDMV